MYPILFLCPFPFIHPPRFHHTLQHSHHPNSPHPNLHSIRTQSGYPILLTCTSSPQWQQIGRTSVLLPPKPTLLIHFIGGAFAGSAPRLAYGTLLEGISFATDAGIIATGYDVSNDHWSIIEHVMKEWERSLYCLEDVGIKGLNVIGLGHSLGTKLIMMLEGQNELKERGGNRIANVMMAFNNYGVGKMIGGMNKVVNGVGDVVKGIGLDRYLQNVDVARVARAVREGARTVAEEFGGQEVGGKFDDILGRVAKAAEAVSSGAEFIPSPAEVEEIAEKVYRVQSTLIVKFKDDQLDESEGLLHTLRGRLGEKRVLFREIPGTHVTPLTPRLEEGNLRNVGNEVVNQAVQRSAEKARRELQRLITIVVAFIRLQAELSEDWRAA